MAKFLNKNIIFKSKQIVDFYSLNRQTWREFYSSERWVFNRIGGLQKELGSILDVGCACGGLGKALAEMFIFKSYTGIDINKDAIKYAKRKIRLSVPTIFISGDILKEKSGNSYDTVVSLSCADWNIETEKIINSCWEKVKNGGYFVISLRVTFLKGINNMKISYQHINFTGKENKPEIANYAVFNYRSALRMMRKLTPRPGLIGAYGYLGQPSSTAVTPLDRVIFTVFYIRKNCGNKKQKIRYEFNIPVGP